MRHTDDLVAGRAWADISALAARWFNEQDPNLCVEGVAVPRALRKWLAASPSGKPVDELVVLSTLQHERTPQQENMAKGLERVLREIEPELRRRGVRIRRV